ncbi:MAG: cupin domain-containing protein [Planctomycetes bacterium]|nr:cupin domain-containing protein [Planctomycetota bacterium]
MSLRSSLLPAIAVLAAGGLLSICARAITADPPATTPPAPATSTLGATTITAPRPATRIVLIGGKKSHDAGEHDYPNGIPLIAALLKASPAFAGAEVRAQTGGWPSDPAVFDGASTVVLYFDGVQEKPEPLIAAERIARLEKLMAAGTGIVCLHQASTVPKDNTTIPLVSWLGAKRNGMVDRTTETVTLKPATTTHPITFGVGEFTYKDEFYPTLMFNDDASRITPILRAALPKEKPEDRVLAWSFERANGGRGFGFTGCHYITSFDEPSLRTMVLNAIAWTAKLPVPAEGIQPQGTVVPKSVVTRAADRVNAKQAWGELFWHTSAAMKNSAVMTTGTVIIKPGQGNPRHYHPNCDEILSVVSGRIEHTMNEVTVVLEAGDTVSIPRGALHNAKNIGEVDAVLTIAFDSAYREVIGY